MKKCIRGPAPEMIEKHGSEIGKKYATKRETTPSYRFQWPVREGKSLYKIVLSALCEMTEEHCAYCDGYHLDATGTKSIDHFRPKNRPEFYELVCSGENLYLTCSACNTAKRD